MCVCFVLPKKIDIDALILLETFLYHDFSLKRLKN